MARIGWIMLVVLGGLAGSNGAVAGNCTSAVYYEGFNADAGTFTLVNGDDTSAGWAFDDSCPAAASAPGGPGTLRWGSFADCSSSGSVDHFDKASTPFVTLYEGCILSFDYNLDVTGAGSAVVEALIGDSSQVLLSSAGGTLVNDGQWHVAAVLVEEALRIDFIGSTDGASTNAAGWTIDEVTIECPVADCAVPATDVPGNLFLLAATTFALAWFLLLRRRSPARRGRAENTESPAG